LVCPAGKYTSTASSTPSLIMTYLYSATGSTLWGVCEFRKPLTDTIFAGPWVPGPQAKQLMLIALARHTIALVRPTIALVRPTIALVKAHNSVGKARNSVGKGPQ
jgi:hypothetical protein